MDFIFKPVQNICIEQVNTVHNIYMNSFINVYFKTVNDVPVQ